MKTSLYFTLLCTILLAVVACSPVSTAQTPVRPAAPTATTSPPTATLMPFPLAQPGPFKVGKRSFSINDDSRALKYPVFITVWYPALSSEDKPVPDAEADLSQAPYPLILSSTKVAKIFAPILVSHGFTWASIDYIDSYMAMNKSMLSQPREILFALEQVATNPPEGLAGMFDADLAGTIGYSFDGYNSLAMSGARIDPEFYLSQCPTPDASTAPLVTHNSMSAFSCNPAENWEDFLASVEGLFTSSEDGLWQPISDERIRAVMPMAPEGWWLFGERGLAFVDRPVLMIGSTQDPLYQEDALIFEHLGTTDKTLISFVGKDHMMIYEAEMIERMTHFAVAFFSFNLQGMEEMAWYFSEDYVNQQPDLVWGVYREP